MTAPDCSCYAMFRYGFPSVKARWDNNLKLTKSSSFVDRANIELKYKGSNIVRFHESGDFYNMAYINKCYKLAKQKHLCYYIFVGENHGFYILLTIYNYTYIKLSSQEKKNI